MEKISEKIKGIVPAQSIRNMSEYSTKDFAIFKPRAIINETLCLDSYHFALTTSQMPALIIDNKVIEIEPNRLYPTNPEQILSVATPCYNEVKEYTTIFIEKQFLRELSKLIFGRSDIFFINEGYRITAELIGLIRQFIHESQNKQIGYEFILQNLSNQIAIVLLRQLKNNFSETIKEKKYTDKTNINRAIEFIHQYYNDDFSLTEVAKVANLSLFHFIRIFKMETGKTPYEYLIDIKIERAKEMLNSKQYSITEISLLCGFTNPSHFASIFKKKTGMSPSAYIKMLI